jgi:hypothetical protein
VGFTSASGEVIWLRGDTLANPRDDSHEQWQMVATLLVFILLLACVIFGLVFFGLLGIIVFTLAILLASHSTCRNHPL